MPHPSPDYPKPTKKRPEGITLRPFHAQYPQKINQDR